MFAPRDESLNPHVRVSGLPMVVWFYLSAEFLIGTLVAVLLGFLTAVKCLLPKPPRSLIGDTVVVTGAGSGLGRALAEEFFKAGCTVACIDQDLRSVQETALNLRSQYPRVESIGPEHRKYESPKQTKSFAYECNLTLRGDILNMAKKISEDVGQVDILVTCAGSPEQGILDTIDTTLMSHYWTMLAFLPSMLQRQKAHIVGITPTTSTDNAYMGSRAAVAGLMEALGQEFSSSSHLSFITVAPKAEPRLLKQSERQTAREVVEAVRRDQSTLTMSWGSKTLYSIGCIMHQAITGVTRWLYRQGCGSP